MTKTHRVAHPTPPRLRPGVLMTKTHRVAQPTRIKQLH